MNLNPIRREPYKTHSNWRARVQHALASNKPFSSIHSNASHHILTQVRSHLQNKPDLVVQNLQSRQNRGQTILESHIDDGTDNLADLPDRPFTSELVSDFSSVRIFRRRLGRRSRRSCRGGVVRGESVEEVAGGRRPRAGPRGR